MGRSVVLYQDGERTFHKDSEQRCRSREGVFESSFDLRSHTSRESSSDVSAQQSDSNNPIESLPVVDKLRTSVIVVDFKCLLSKIYQGIRKNVSKEKFPTEQHRQSEPSKILGNICNKIAVTCHDLGGDVVKYGPHEIVVMWPDTKVTLADRVASAVTASLKITTDLSKNLKIILVRLIGNVEDSISVVGVGT